MLLMLLVRGHENSGHEVRLFDVLISSPNMPQLARACPACAAFAGPVEPPDATDSLVVQSRFAIETDVDLLGRLAGRSG